MDFHQRNDRTAWVVVNVDHRGRARERERGREIKIEREKGGEGSNDEES